MSTSTKCLKEKVQALWKTAQDVVRKRVKKAVVSSFEAKLDKLLDITKCKCEIQTCKEIGCAGCEFGAHVTCGCPREVKLPQLDLLFLKSQREKIGERGSIMIADSIDTVEQNKKEKMIARKELEKKRSERRKEKEIEKETTEAEARQHFEEITLCEDLGGGDDQGVDGREDDIEDRGESTLLSTEGLLKKRNMVDVKRLASTAIRLMLSFFHNF